MKEMLTELHDAALSQLNPSVLSSDSFRAMIYLLLGIGISVFFIKKLRGIVSWWIGLTLFVEIMHFITYQTPLGTMFPICQTLFKYDVFSMFAQLCVGTKLCDIILYIRALLEGTIGSAVMIIWNFVVYFWNFMKENSALKFYI